ncbi:MAG: glycosyltransferase family 39 protein, partial [Chloroflexota bacterium]
MNFSLVLRNPNITGDGIQYTSVVFNWFQGNGYTNVVGIPWLVEPGYGFLTYLFNIFIGDIELSGMLVSSAAYLLLILLVYFTVRYLGSALAALLSVLFVAFYPYLLTFSWLNLTDSVFSFFVFLCFSVYVRVLLEEKKVV